MRRNDLVAGMALGYFVGKSCQPSSPSSYQDPRSGVSFGRAMFALLVFLGALMAIFLFVLGAAVLWFQPALDPARTVTGLVMMAPGALWLAVLVIRDASKPAASANAKPQPNFPSWMDEVL